MKRHAPATARNSAAIGAVLAEELPQHGLVFEVASGTGEHAVCFAARFPQLAWQPSDVESDGLASIAAWREEADLPNLLPPLAFSTTDARCPVTAADALFCANMIHISEWDATLGLFRHARDILPENAPLVLYGPFIEPGIETAPSNIAFDASLRARNAAWRLRSIDQLDGLATDAGFTRSARHPMPANNLILVYRKQP